MEPAFNAAFNTEWAGLAAGITAQADAQRREAVALSRKIDHLVDAISDGDRSPSLRAKLAELEARRDRIAWVVEVPATRPPALHPGIAETYRAKVDDLRRAMADKDNHAALEAARALIDRVIISPPEHDDEPPGIELVGDLAELLRAAGLGPTRQGNGTSATDVLNTFASSVKDSQGTSRPLTGPGQRPGLIFAPMGQRPGSAHHRFELCPPMRHVAVVLVQCAREGVSTAAIGDEVQVLGVCRVCHRLQRSQSWAGDRPGRQSDHAVGIIGRGPVQISPCQRTLQRARPA
jgi:hypothetical protein